MRPVNQCAYLMCPSEEDEVIDLPHELVVPASIFPPTLTGRLLSAFDAVTARFINLSMNHEASLDQDGMQKTMCTSARMCGGFGSETSISAA